MWARKALPAPMVRTGVTGWMVKRVPKVPPGKTGAMASMASNA